MVKRVIGLPNELIEIKDNKVYANGELLDDSFIKEPMITPDQTIQLKDDEYFVMGDNRNNSCDARFWESYVKDSEIKSIIKYRIYPFNKMRKFE